MKTNATLESFARSLGCQSYAHFCEVESNLGARLRFSTYGENMEHAKACGGVIDTVEIFLRVKRMFVPGFPIHLIPSTVDEFRRCLASLSAKTGQTLGEVILLRGIKLWMNQLAGLCELKAMENHGLEQCCADLEMA